MAIDTVTKIFEGLKRDAEYRESWFLSGMDDYYESEEYEYTEIPYHCEDKYYDEAMNESFKFKRNYKKELYELGLIN